MISGKIAHLKGQISIKSCKCSCCVCDRSMLAWRSIALGVEKSRLWENSPPTNAPVIKVCGISWFISRYERNSRDISRYVFQSRYPPLAGTSPSTTLKKNTKRFAFPLFWRGRRWRSDSICVTQPWSLEV